MIIGKPGRYISKADAFDYVAGYACYNDGSVRDFSVTRISSPLARISRHRCLRPVDGDLDELGDLGPLRLQTRVNGQDRAGREDRADDLRYPYGRSNTAPRSRAWNPATSSPAARQEAWAPSVSRRCGSSPGDMWRWRSRRSVCSATASPMKS